MVCMARRPYQGAHTEPGTYTSSQVCDRILMYLPSPARLRTVVSSSSHTLYPSRVPSFPTPQLGLFPVISIPDIATSMLSCRTPLHPRQTWALPSSPLTIRSQLLLLLQLGYTSATTYFTVKKGPRRHPNRPSFLSTLPCQEAIRRTIPTRLFPPPISYPPSTVPRICGAKSWAAGWTSPWTRTNSLFTYAGCMAISVRNAGTPSIASGPTVYARSRVWMVPGARAVRSGMRIMPKTWLTIFGRHTSASKRCVPNAGRS
jgi:hypothetical protein